MISKCQKNGMDWLDSSIVEIDQQDRPETRHCWSTSPICNSDFAFQASRWFPMLPDKSNQSVLLQNYSTSSSQQWSSFFSHFVCFLTLVSNKVAAACKECRTISSGRISCTAKRRIFSFQVLLGVKLFDIRSSSINFKFLIKFQLANDLTSAHDSSVIQQKSVASFLESH